MDEHEDQQREKEKREPEKETGCLKTCSKKTKSSKMKITSKKCKSLEYSGDFDESKEDLKQLCLQKQKTKEETTKELISFLKNMIEAEQKKREVVKEEKAISPYVSEDELITTVYSELPEEFLDEVEEEDVEEEEFIEEEESESGINKDADGYVDMDEVKKKLEELQGEEKFEDEEAEDEDEDEFLEGEFDEWLRESSQELPIMQDASAQFNYFLERKVVVPKKPKNITEDLALFMRTVIMGDRNLRAILEEKELLEFKHKQLDFMNMGMLIKRPKPCKCIKKKKGVKNKCKCKCCTKGGKGKHIQCEEDKDLTYNIRPNEFMLMLQVLMNTLEVIEEQDRLLLPPSTVSSEILSEPISVFISDESDIKEEEEEEEDDDDDDIDDDDDDI